jgi:hypothetical protein
LGAYTYIVVDKRKPREMPQFKWVKTILGNLKTMIGGGYKAFKFRKHLKHYPGAFAYRFQQQIRLGSNARRTARPCCTCRSPA